MEKQKKIIILFDGDCFICNRFIQIPMKYGVVNFLFVSSQSKKGEEICNRLGIISGNGIDTIYLLNEGDLNFELKSNAIVRILMSCTWYHKVLAFLIAVVPRIIRDYFYDLIAKNRVGTKNKSCKIPTNIDRNKIFL